MLFDWSFEYLLIGLFTHNSFEKADNLCTIIGDCHQFKSYKSETVGDHFGFVAKAEESKSCKSISVYTSVFERLCACYKCSFN